MNRRVILAVVVLALIAALTGAISAAPERGDGRRVDIRVWPSTSMAPAHLLVRVYIERYATNRRVRITVESDEYFGSSEGQLEGERSSRLWTVRFGKLPAGMYDLRAVVLDQNGDVSAAARTSAIVLGR